MKIFVFWGLSNVWSEKNPIMYFKYYFNLLLFLRSLLIHMLVIPKLILLVPPILYLSIYGQCSVEFKKYYNIFKSKSQSFKIKPFRFYCTFLFIRFKEHRLGIIYSFQVWVRVWINFRAWKYLIFLRNFIKGE